MYAKEEQRRDLMHELYQPDNEQEFHQLNQTNDLFENQEHPLQLTQQNFNEPHPLDGGWGYIITAAAFCVAFQLDGFESSYGILLPHVISTFGGHVALASMCGGLLTGVILATGPFSAFLVRKYGCRNVSFVGAIIASTSIAMATTAQRIELFVLCYGVFAGFGMGLVYLPANIMVNAYFDKKRGMVMGIVTSGSGIGLFVIASLTNYLIEEYHWRGCYLIIAGILLHLAVCASLMRPLEDNFPEWKRRSRLTSAGLSANGNHLDKPFNQSTNKVTKEYEPEAAKADCSFGRNVNALNGGELISTSTPLLLDNGFTKQSSKKDDPNSTRKFATKNAANAYKKNKENDFSGPDSGYKTESRLKLSSRNEEVSVEDINAVTNNSNSDSVRADTDIPKCPDINLQTGDHFEKVEIVDGSDEKHTQSCIFDTENGSDIERPKRPDGDTNCLYEPKQTSQKESPNGRFNSSENVDPQYFQLKSQPDQSHHHRHYQQNTTEDQHHHNTHQIQHKGSPHLQHSSTKSKSNHLALTVSSHLSVSSSKSNSLSVHRYTHKDSAEDLLRPVLHKTDLLNILPELLASVTSLSIGTAHSGSVLSLRSRSHSRASNLNSNKSPLVWQSGSSKINSKDFGSNFGETCVDEDVIQLELERVSRDLGDDSKEMHSSWSLFKILPFDLFCVGAFLVQVVSMVPTMFMPSYVAAKGFTASTAATLVSILGISNTAGRLMAGFLSYVGLGTLRVYNTGTCLAGLACFLMPWCSTFTTLILFAAGHGFFIGFFPPLQSVILVELLGVEKLPSSFGIMCVCKSIASVSGPFFAGALYEWSSDYAVLFYFAGWTMVVANIVHCVMSFCREPMKNS